jgi:hypothetical protein
VRAKQICVFVIGVVLAIGAQAATYYIDYAGGDDANTGNSVEAPWKRAPGMKGFAGSYRHTAGDRFIFKGGVTWPAACYQWKITAGGSSEAVRDYYGVDRSWYAGEAYSRPVFDFEHTLIGPGGWADGAGILVQGCNYITFDGLDVANHRAALAQNGISTWGTFSICFDTANNNTVTNCVVRDWDLPTPIVTGTSGGGGIIRINTGNLNVVTHCEFHQQGVPVKSGTCIWNIFQVDNCHIHHTPTAIMSSQIVHHNYIHDLPAPTDPAAHSNVMLCNGGLLAYNNVIHDISPVAQVIFVAPGYYGAGSDLIYNNLVYNVAQPCIAIDTDGLNHPNSSSRIYNNTLVAPSGFGPCIRVGYRANGNLPLLDCRNNHLISGGRPILYNNPASGGGIVSSLTAAAQLSQTYAEAEAAGYSAANRYAPIRSGSPTVRAGLDLSNALPLEALDLTGRARPAGAWDVGAYQYGGTIPVFSPTLASQP